jgi:hypothetical protein
MGMGEKWLQTCDMGQTALLPSKGRRAEDFFAKKI